MLFHVINNKKNDCNNIPNNKSKALNFMIMKNILFYEYFCKPCSFVLIRVVEIDFSLDGDHLRISFRVISTSAAEGRPLNCNYTSSILAW